MKYNYQKESLDNKIKRWVRMSIRYSRYFHLPKRGAMKNVVCFIVDPAFKHPGLADRLKAIVNTYYIAKKSNLDFKLFFNAPFPFIKYYEPNKVDWSLDLNDLDYSLFSAKLAAYIAEQPIPIWKKGWQYHLYWYRGIDSILHAYRIKYDNTKIAYQKWFSTTKTCFDELFKPSKYLKELFSTTQLESRSYISVHFRFVNALGFFEKAVGHPILPKKEQEKLIRCCLDWLQILSERHKGMPIYVFSDSERFLGICEKNGYNRIQGGKISHISSVHNEASDDKTMLDFYTMGCSKKVYAIVLPHMYFGLFSEYAATVGGSEFERIANYAPID